MRKNIFFVLFYAYLTQITTNSLSQNLTVAQQERYISGRNTDADNNEPVPGASVFFDNTTVGISTNANGEYRLRIPGQGSYRLTVSHVGYQTVFMDIEPETTAMKFDTAMQSIELEELNVATRVRFRQADINLFWRTILGKNPSRRTIQATNTESVFYYYNPETKILKVTCREPLQIVNYETGYRIQYVLNNFTHDYNSGLTDWRYQSVFTELEPQNARQKDTWDKNRKEVYDVSLTKFVKSLYNNTLLNDGFVLANFDRSLFSRDEILQTNPITNSKTINTNGLVLLICYGKPVSDSDLARLKASQQNEKQTSNQTSQTGRIPVIEESAYTRERERVQSIRNSDGYLDLEKTKQRQAMSSGLYNHGKITNLLQGDSIRIFPDGTFTNILSMGRVNNSESLMGLSLRLPIEYATEVSTLLAMELAFDENKYILEDISQYFDTQLRVFPQGKIHLHTDRDYYIPGERIWFKA
jgi:hypothetical protein